jgi:AcrR family transcriptional regulator
LGIETRRLKERKARVESIKNSAWKIFLKNGFDQAKIAEIAKDCELGLSTLYNYFKDKRQIVYSLMLDFKTDNNKQLRQLIEQKVTYREFLEKYIQIHLEDNDRFRFFVFADSFYNYHSQYDLSDPVLDKYDKITSQNGQYVLHCLLGEHDAELLASIRVALNMVYSYLKREIFSPKKNWPRSRQEKIEMQEILLNYACIIFENIGFDLDKKILPIDEI